MMIPAAKKIERLTSAAARKIAESLPESPGTELASPIGALAVLKRR